MPERKDTIGRVGPLRFTGPAAERDVLVREDNDSPKLDVSKWLERLADQDAAMSKSEAEFFQTLRSLSR